MDLNETEAQANDYVEATFEDDIEIQSEMVDEIAYIETTIESDKVTVDGILELDFETSDMTIAVELKDEDMNVVSTSMDIVIKEIEGENFTALLTDLDTGETYEVNTSEVTASWYPLVVIAISVARYGIQYAIKKYGKSAVTKATSKYGKNATAQSLKKLNFASKKRFDGHWKDHKNEFPGLTQAQYLTRAQSLANTSGKHILVKKRPDGDIVKYNTNTNELLILDKNDVIRTLFKPKHPNASRGREYFNNMSGTLK
jgi:hypothetical protein